VEVAPNLVLDQYRRSEVPAPLAANSSQELQIEKRYQHHRFASALSRPKFVSARAARYHELRMRGTRAGFRSSNGAVAVFGAGQIIRRLGSKMPLISSTKGSGACARSSICFGKYNEPAKQTGEPRQADTGPSGYQRACCDAVVMPSGRKK
jgi:hypothetical protein